MCLNIIDKIHAVPSYHIETRWKCFTHSGGQPIFPFFGLTGKGDEENIQVPQDRWILCSNDIVRKNLMRRMFTIHYPAGFHTFLSEEAALAYAATRRERRFIIVQVQVMGVRTIGRQNVIPVDVTDWMFLRSEDWIEAKQEEGGEA